jgi:predicted metal-binding protein
VQVFLCFIKICAGVEQSENHNYKYMGIDALGRIIKLNPDFAEKHQLAVIDCLEACCYQIDVSLL